MKKFLDSIGRSLPDIQSQFDDYQKSHFPERSPQFFCLELNGEAGELANLEKKKWKNKIIGDDMLADEAADVFIALMNYSNSRNIDLAGAVVSKLRWIDDKMKMLKAKGEDF